MQWVALVCGFVGSAIDWWFFTEGSLLAAGVRGLGIGLLGVLIIASLRVFARWHE